MRVAILLGVLFVLTGCARDNYTVIPEGPGSQARMASDLHDCKMQAVHQYYANRNSDGVGIALGAAIGGAIGGALVGAAQSQDGDPPSTMNRLTEGCMKARGYSGTSEG